jgi:hypothetical protein
LKICLEKLSDRAKIKWKLDKFQNPPNWYCHLMWSFKSFVEVENSNSREQTLEMKTSVGLFLPQTYSIWIQTFVSDFTCNWYQFWAVSEMVIECCGLLNYKSVSAEVHNSEEGYLKIFNWSFSLMFRMGNFSKLIQTWFNTKLISIQIDRSTVAVWRFNRFLQSESWLSCTQFKETLPWETMSCEYRKRIKSVMNF